MLALLIFLQNEAARNLIGAPGEGAVEGTIINLVQWLKLAIERPAQSSSASAL
jgi:hypothetical protein